MRGHGGENRHDAAAWGRAGNIWCDEGGREGSIGTGILGLRDGLAKRSRAAGGGWRGRIAILHFAESVGFVKTSVFLFTDGIHFKGPVR
jgi:hypothetical protein